jgi:tyrosine-protein kinase Etk/Wzc
MILGKTVDDLNLQTLVKEKYFPLFGEGWARLTGEKPQSISVSRFYVGEIDNKMKLNAKMTVLDSKKLYITGENFELKVKLVNL